MRWVDNFRGRKDRKQKEIEAAIEHEARRIATGAVLEATERDKAFRRAFKGIVNRADAEILEDIGRKRQK